MRKSVVLVLAFFSVQVYAQDLESILEKHFQAHGQEFWEQVSSIEVSGEWVNKAFDKFPMHIVYKSPSKVRMDGTWFDKPYARVTNGRIAWMIAPWTGSPQPQMMPPAEHLMIANLLTNGSPLMSYENEITLSGLELYEGELLIKLEYEDDYFHREYYLGREDYRLYWEVVQSNIGKKHALKKNYEKYRDYNGMLMPTAIRAYLDDQVLELVFEDVALGVGAPNTLFEYPEDP